MMHDIAELIERWNSPEGRPYKGRLYDPGDWNEEGDVPLGCMCAQGQVLHVVAGWQPADFRKADQAKADSEVAKLLNISRAHSVLLRNVNDKIDGAPAIVLALSDDGIGKVLSGEWSKLLDFWWHMDTLDSEGWRKVAAARTAARTAARDAAGDAAWDAAWTAAWTAARDAARDAAWTAAGDAAWDAAGDAAWDAARDAARDAAGDAAWEIQGAHIFRADKRPFFFLPVFGFADPAEIPARPANYGVSK